MTGRKAILELVKKYGIKTEKTDKCDCGKDNDIMIVEEVEPHKQKLKHVALGKWERKHKKSNSKSKRKRK
jgi:hypothetical protein